MAKVKKSRKKDKILGHEETHPAFGMISIDRSYNCSGRRPLFGSNLVKHPTLISVSIKRGVRCHHLSYDSYFERGLPIAEVDLSATQFTELLTTMNHGSGTPCTLRWANGKRVPDLEEDESEIERLQSELIAELKERTDKLKKTRDSLKEILAGVSKKKQKEATAALDSAIAELEGGLAFVLEQFQEATDKVVMAAKGEVVSYIDQMAGEEGAKILAEKFGIDPKKQLTGE